MGKITYSKIDARTAIWTAQWPVQDSFNYPVILSGGSNICFNGGIINGSYPVQISTDANATWEYMRGTTAILVNTKNTTFENTRINNYGDGIGIKYGAENFLLNKVHLSDIRDDCLENDWLYSGTVIDSLFDGCYSGFSARTYSSQSPFPTDSSQNLITIKDSLIRLEATWGVYKNRGIIPGHDEFFKWEDMGISPRLSLHNNIFRVDQTANNVGLGIPFGKLASCSNNIMVWLGSGNYPEPLPQTLNGQPCFTITTDKILWDNAVNTWISTH